MGTLTTLTQIERLARRGRLAGDDEELTVPMRKGNRVISLKARREKRNRAYRRSAGLPPIVA